ncbi:MAG: Hsp20/alpha crystallin family protein [Bacteroidota bacterium]
MSLIKTRKNRDLYPSLLSDFFATDRFFSPGWLERESGQTVPSVNIRENGKEFHVELAVPGFSKTDFKISVEDNVLTISAEKKEEEKEENERFTRKEFSYNSFSRSFTLPQTVNADKVDARYADGILKLCIPKKEEAKALTKKEINVA